MGRYTSSGRINSLVTNIGPFPWELVKNVQDAKIDLSTTQVSQLTLTILDPDLFLVRENFFGIDSDIVIGGPSGQWFRVRAREMVMVENQVGLQVTARSKGQVIMSGFKGNLVRSNISPTSYIQIDAQAAGLRFVGQPSAVRASIVRTQDATNNTNESSWDVAQRLAQEDGYWLFESAGTVYYGKPSWLVGTLPKFDVRWRQEATTDPLTSVPLMSNNADNPNEQITGAFSVHQDAADSFIPGVAVHLDGIQTNRWLGGFDGTYLVTTLSLDLDGKSPGDVTISQPIDPIPGDNAPSASILPPGAGNFNGIYPTVQPGPLGLTPTGLTWPVDGAVKGTNVSEIDIYASYGDPVLAPAPGTVVAVGSTSGPSVRISHGNHIFTLLSNLRSVSVVVGQQVSRGMRVGTVGGSPAVPYCRLQVFVDTKLVAPISYFPRLTV